MNITDKIKIIEIQLSRILYGWLLGNYKSHFHWQGMDFSEHNEYQLWEPIKNIDWKVSSRTNRIYIKKYEEEKDLEVLFILDNSYSMLFHSQNVTKKDILEQTFLMLWLSAYQNNDKIGAIIFDDDIITHIEPKKDKWNIIKIIDWLTQKTSQKRKKITTKIDILNNILTHLYKSNTQNKLIFVLTDIWEWMNEKMLRLLQYDNDIVFINIFDNFENNMSYTPWDVAFQNWWERISINMRERKKIELYNQIRQKKLLYTQKTLNNIWSWYIYLDTKTDILKTLLKYFYNTKKL